MQRQSNNSKQQDNWQNRLVSLTLNAALDSNLSFGFFSPEDRSKWMPGLGNRIQQIIKLIATLDDPEARNQYCKKLSVVIMENENQVALEKIADEGSISKFLSDLLLANRKMAHLNQILDDTVAGQRPVISADVDSSEEDEDPLLVEEFGDFEDEEERHTATINTSQIQLALLKEAQILQEKKIPGDLALDFEEVMDGAHSGEIQETDSYDSSIFVKALREDLADKQELDAPKSSQLSSIPRPGLRSRGYEE